MAEVVQVGLELLTEELEEMRRTKLMTVEETRELLQKRRGFENDIHSLSKGVNSYTDYINFERALLKGLQLRRNKLQIGEKKASIENQIIKRINLLYETALHRYPNEIPLFLEFIKFCKKVNMSDAAFDTVSNMVKLHPDDPQIWQVSANWHAYDRKDIDTALAMLWHAIDINKNSQLLYRELVQIELYHVAQNVEPQGNKAQLEKKLKNLEEIINMVFDNIGNCEFCIELLNLTEKYSFASEIGNIIADRLLKEFCDNENVWHTLAQRERKDVSTPDADNNESTRKSRTPKARLEACIAKYKQGLNTVSPATKPKLWSLYLHFLKVLQGIPYANTTVLKTEALKSALSEISSEGHLTEDDYMAWLELVNDKEAFEIAKKGTDAFPNSVKLWKARLRLQIVKNDYTEVNQVFRLGIMALKERALPLWSSILRYHYLTSDDDYIELIYADAVKQPREISDAFKPRYLEWLVLTKGIEATREVYLKLAVEKPYCKELHTMMARLESLEIDSNFELWGNVHKLACEQFGQHDVDVWINYITFYLDFNKKCRNLHECVKRIQKQAEATLPQALMMAFRSKYDKVKASE